MSEAKIDATVLMQAGVAILEPLMTSHGFRFALGTTGLGSGGEFSSGQFVRGSRILEFHFRHSLGMVTYHLGSSSIPHESYMALVAKTRHYPGFSLDSLDGFRHLLLDLEENCEAFLGDTDEQFQRVVQAAVDLQPIRGLPA